MAPMKPQTPAPPPAGKNLSDKLDAAGWGLFFVWVGSAVLADVGWG